MLSGRIGVLVLAQLILMLAAPAAANLVYLETFDTDVLTDATYVTFQSVYPQLSVSGPGTVAVTNGRLETTGAGMQVGLFGQVSKMKISADIGSQAGDIPVYLAIGVNTLLFKPGLESAGVFEVSGPGGFTGEPMGFDLQAGKLYHFEVIQHVNGDFEFSVRDPDEPTNVYANSFNSVSSVGGFIGLGRGPQIPPGSGLALFDNLALETIQSVPAPGVTPKDSIPSLSRWGLIVLSTLLLAFGVLHQRRRRPS